MYSNIFIYLLNIGNELFFDNGNVNHDVSILLGYVAKQRFLSAQVKVSGGFVRNRLLNVILPLVC